MKHPNHCGLEVSATRAMSLEQTPQQGSVQAQVQASHSRRVSLISTRLLQGLWSTG